MNIFTFIRNYEKSGIMRICSMVAVLVDRIVKYDDIKNESKYRIVLIGK